MKLQIKQKIMELVHSYSRDKNSGPFMMLGKPLFFLDAQDFKNHKYHNYFTITI